MFQRLNCSFSPLLVDLPVLLFTDCESIYYVVLGPCLLAFCLRVLPKMYVINHVCSWVICFFHTLFRKLAPTSDPKNQSHISNFNSAFVILNHNHGTS